MWDIWLKAQSPVYWYQYLWLNNVPSPENEARLKHDKLKHIEKNLVSFLGAGGRIMELYDKVLKLEENEKQVLKLALLNQEVIRMGYYAIASSFQQPVIDINCSFAEIKEARSASTVDLYRTLKHNIESFESFHGTLDRILQAYGRPSYARSHWIQLLLGAIVASCKIFNILC